MQNMPKEAWIALIVLVILALGFDPGFFVLLFLAGLLYFARNMLENNNTSVTSQNSYQPPVRSRRSEPVYEEEVYEEEEILPERSGDDPLDHAAEAITNAGRNPYSLQVLPLDLGLFSYTGNENPMIHQVAPVSDDVDYVQPYVQLKLPRSAKGRIRFELVDRTGRVVYVHEDNYQLQKGKNLIVPSTRMRVQRNTLDMNGAWQLRISADNMLIAQHAFDWEDSEAVKAGIRAHIEEDGEISNDLRNALAENRLQKMSLDELLSFQDDDEQQSARRN